MNPSSTDTNLSFLLFRDVAWLSLYSAQCLFLVALGVFADGSRALGYLGTSTRGCRRRAFGFGGGVSGSTGSVAGLCVAFGFGGGFQAQGCRPDQQEWQQPQGSERLVQGRTKQLGRQQVPKEEGSFYSSPLPDGHVLL